jgi:DNA-binding transcriptional LysR family regulator
MEHEITEGGALELRHLRYFSAVAETKSLSKASDIVHVTQPALSRQIKDLEEEIGSPLFIRKPSGVRLTETGRVFLRSSKQILSFADAALREASGVGKNTTTALRVGFEETAIASWFFSALHEVGRCYPKVTLAITEGTPRPLIQQLRSGALDVCLISSNDLDTAPDLIDHPLSRRQLRLLLGVSHRLAGHTSIDLGQLANEPLILVDDSYQSAILRACRRAGFEPALISQANSYASMLGLVAAQRGYCLSPQDAGLSKLDEIRTIPLVRPISCPGASAVWMRDKPLELRERFLETLLIKSGAKPMPKEAA